MIYNGKDLLLGLCLAVAMVIAADAGTASAADAAEALRKCANMSDDAARLACYDALAQKGARPDKTLTTPQASPPARTAQPPEITDRQQREAFGKPLVPRLDAIQEILVTVVQSRKTRYGKLIFTTEGGQVWRDVGDKSSFIPKRPFAASIKKGALGSFFLVITGTKTAVRVKRVK